MAEKENSLIIKLKKPVKFEGNEVKEIDLSGLKKLKTKDLIEAEKQFGAEGNFAPQYETTVAYARIIAEKVTKYPLEFFDQLGKEMFEIRNVVMSFFYEEE